MRLLVASVPGAGHVNPLLPLALAARAAGHDVLWATGPQALRGVTAAGIEGVPAGPDFPALFAQLAARTRGTPGDGIPGERLPHWFAPRLFGEVGTPLMVDDLLAAARDFAPDAVLFDSRCYAGAVAAAAVGALPVLQAVTRLLPPEAEQLVSDAVTPLWRSLGLPVPHLAGMFDGLTVSAWPASLDDPSGYGDLDVLRLAPVAAAAPPPPWLGELADRPLVYATLGTVFTGDAAMLGAIVEGVTACDVSLVLTTGAAFDPAALGPLPPRTRVERFVPQEALLPHCAAVVSHGGSGTALGALAHGLPHVALPQGADQFGNAGVLERHGLGRWVRERPFTAPAITTALQEVLGTPSVAEGAGRVGAEMARGATPEDALAAVTAAVTARLSEAAQTQP